jgi:hypothetical protein
MVFCDTTGALRRNVHYQGTAIETAEPKPPVFERSSAGVPLFPDDGHRLTAEMVRKPEEDALD